jgi:hypothetical protein
MELRSFIVVLIAVEDIGKNAIMEKPSARAVPI